MKMLITAVALLSAAPAVAQTVPPPPVPAQSDAGGLTGSVSDDAAWQDLGIAIPKFATDADVPTQTSAGSTGALGMALAQIITADLKNNGLFKPTGPDGLPQPAFSQVRAPDFPTWSGRSAEMLVQGDVRAGADGNVTVGCYLYDVALSQQLTAASWTVAPADWRRAAHKCADLVYSRLSGESPFFDSRIAYIAETGPKDHRMKRLAIMDSDGQNHRFLTTGQTLALTPRYSPDYRSILYLSYFNGNPRIYIYDLATDTQRLLLKETNPLFAPRWSPDGKWVLYSMASGGNTEIYKMPAAGGSPLKLTDSPGIDIGGSFSPDGSRIVFESDRSGTQQVYVMNADGSNQRRISFFGGRAATPEWSPRGDQIAFTHIVGNLRIAVMDPNGRNLRYLTDAWQDEAPTWAPNGRIIQFFRTAQGSGKTQLWQVDLTGRNERRLATPVDGSDPAWGPIRP
ncbi:Tol-Pal system beta propeller repeat protein TolB [Parablastomonas sp. CN1-191]|uniref:Tol-Pal system beta propeller repeat protein TolB n=1 Tax=Parablastomonas sp. CN1-191 TaxID=3400908 RepID=UPI003BF89C16